MTPRPLSALTAVGLTLLNCGAPFAQTPVSAPAPANAHVSATIVTGAETYPTHPVIEDRLHPGDVSLNFPAADVRELCACGSQRPLSTAASAAMSAASAAGSRPTRAAAASISNSWC